MQINNQWRDNAGLMVVWADGTYDSMRHCSHCLEQAEDPKEPTKEEVLYASLCQTQVHRDKYTEVGETRLERGEDAELMAGYWDYMYGNQPLGGKFDFDGELVVKEFFTANPDRGICVHNNIAEKCDQCVDAPDSATRHSGISAEQHELAQEAYALLSPKQKQVWDLVMREQVSQEEAATRLGVDKRSVSDRLIRAEQKFYEFINRHKGEI